MINCKCPRCNQPGERFAVGEYTELDESFICNNCGFKGGN